MLFALSDTVLLAIIGVIGAAVNGAGAVVLIWMQNRTKVAVDVAADKAAASAKTNAVMTAQVKGSIDAVKVDAAASATKAAVHAEEVKATLEEANAVTADKLDSIAEKADKTAVTTEAVHVLVNSAMSSQLKVAAVALRRVAELTGDEADLHAADLAEKTYHGHEMKQKIVDDGGQIKPGTSAVDVEKEPKP